MLKRSFCIFLALLIISSTLTRLFYFAGYELNKDYIAKVLCINLDKPQLHCNGKCYLSKKIAEAEKKQQNNERKTQKDLSQQNVVLADFKFVFFDTVPQKEPLRFLEQQVKSRSFSIFHPPQIV